MSANLRNEPVNAVAPTNTNLKADRLLGLESCRSATYDYLNTGVLVYVRNGLVSAVPHHTKIEKH